LLPKDGERPLDEFVPLLADGHLNPTLFKSIQKIGKKCRTRTKNTIKLCSYNRKNGKLPEQVQSKKPELFGLLCLSFAQRDDRLTVL
jgi:hypothetical protein